MNTGASSRPYVLFLFNYEKVRIEQAIYRFQRLIRIISLCVLDHLEIFMKIFIFGNVFPVIRRTQPAPSIILGVPLQC